MIEKEMEKKLIKAALDARNFSYAPYSGFSVGAALLADDEIITGCNVENAAFGAGCCAERNALFKAVSEGKHRFCAVAIAGGKKDKAPTDYTSPCGVCRQALREFAVTKDFDVIMAKGEDDYKIMTLEDLLPMSFGPDALKED